jgi:hypothetical protein
MLRLLNHGIYFDSLCVAAGEKCNKFPSVTFNVVINYQNYIAPVGDERKKERMNERMNEYGNWSNNTDWRKPKDSVPFCPPQIPHEMARNRSRVFAGINGPITEICSGIYYFQFPIQILILQASSFV